MPKSSSATSSASIAPRSSSGFPNRSPQTLSPPMTICSKSAHAIFRSPTSPVNGSSWGWPSKSAPACWCRVPRRSCWSHGPSPGSASASESQSPLSTSEPARARSPSASPWRWDRTGRAASSPRTSHRTPSRLPRGTARVSIPTNASPSSTARCSPGCAVRSISSSPTSPTCVRSRSRRIRRLPPSLDWRSTAAPMDLISSGQLLADAPRVLAAGGAIGLEIDPSQRDDVVNLARKLFPAVRCSGTPRPRRTRSPRHHSNQTWLRAAMKHPHRRHLPLS